MVLVFVQMHSSLTFSADIECNCTHYDHFIPDSFYGITSCSDELYKCFHKDSSLSIHGVYRCAHKCPVLITENYYHTEYKLVISLKRERERN